MKINIKTIACIGVLVALEVVLSRFLSVVNTQTLKIGFGFLPILLAAIVLGPIAAGIVGGLGDLIGALLFPVGPYFPGFTLTAFLVGIVLGLLLYKRRNTIPMLLLALASVIIHQFIFSLLIDTIWIHLLYGADYTAYIITRIPESTIHSVIEITIIVGLGNKIRDMRGFLLNEQK